MSFEHDRRYKRLFSKPYFLQKLLESFVHEDFVHELDFSTLKRWDKSFIDEAFREKESDLIFSIEFKGRECYIYLLLEFQSTVDKHMPIRFLRYILEFYESNRNLKSGGKYPAVFPLLLYTGDAPWTAEYEIGRMIEQSLPTKYIPAFCYYPICENEISKESLLKIKNAVSAVFYVENSSPQELKYKIDDLFEIIVNEKLEVVEEFAGWFNNYFAGINDISGDNMINRRFDNILEAKGMFATKLEEYKKELLQEGRQEGREEGREEGKLESARMLKAKGVSVTEIARLLEIDIEKVKNL